MLNSDLGVNVDHVATIRNARGGTHPDPCIGQDRHCGRGRMGSRHFAAKIAATFADDDIVRLKAEIAKPLNLEMAATEEMAASR